MIDLDWKRDTARGRSLPLKAASDGGRQGTAGDLRTAWAVSREGGKASVSTWAARLSGHSCAASGQRRSALEGRWQRYTGNSGWRGATAWSRCSAALTTSDSCSMKSPASRRRLTHRRGPNGSSCPGRHDRPQLGARTTMALAGERFLGPIRSPLNPASRPSSPLARPRRAEARTSPERYGSMAEPFLSVTGSIDGDVMALAARPANRAAVFDSNRRVTTSVVLQRATIRCLWRRSARRNVV